MDGNAAAWPGWETVKLIGRGNFGDVYEIRRETFGNVEKAALKVISIPQDEADIDELYSDGYDAESITAVFRDHMQRIVDAEYGVMKKLGDCANIVSCDDIRYVPRNNGIGWDIYFKMELLTPLQKTLPTVIPEETVIKVAKDICSALVFCEKHGMVHGDIKPGKIFLSSKGDYKLNDCGSNRTKYYGALHYGRHDYWAPEVYSKRAYGKAADIYSLGLVLYRMLNERCMPFVPLPAEKRSFCGEIDALSRRLSGEPLPPPAHGSSDLKKIVLKACEYDPKDRYASAADMLPSALQCTSWLH